MGKLVNFFLDVYLTSKLWDFAIVLFLTLIPMSPNLAWYLSISGKPSLTYTLAIRVSTSLSWKMAGSSNHAVLSVYVIVKAISLPIYWTDITLTVGPSCLQWIPSLKSSNLPCSMYTNTCRQTHTRFPLHKSPTDTSLSDTLFGENDFVKTRSLWCIQVQIWGDTVRYLIPNIGLLTGLSLRTSGNCW